MLVSWDHSNDYIYSDYFLLLPSCEETRSFLDYFSMIFFLKNSLFTFFFLKVGTFNFCHNFSFLYLVNLKTTFYYTLISAMFSFFLRDEIPYLIFKDVCGNFLRFIDHWNYGHNYDQSQIRNFLRDPRPRFSFFFHTLTRHKVFFLCHWCQNLWSSNFCQIFLYFSHFVFLL